LCYSYYLNFFEYGVGHGGRYCYARVIAHNDELQTARPCEITNFGQRIFITPAYPSNLQLFWLAWKHPMTAWAFDWRLRIVRKHCS